MKPETKKKHHWVRTLKAGDMITTTTKRPEDDTLTIIEKKIPHGLVCKTGYDDEEITFSLYGNETSPHKGRVGLKILTALRSKYFCNHKREAKKDDVVVVWYVDKNGEQHRKTIRGALVLKNNDYFKKSKGSMKCRDGTISESLWECNLNTDITAFLPPFITCIFNEKLLK